MKAILISVAAFFVLSGCNKMADSIINKGLSSTASNQFIKYTIHAGNNYCDSNSFKMVDVSEMKFVARFDSTAIYQTKDPSNQYDINKLYGFSDNNADHHSYSARFGWRWSDSALRLFAYVYNSGEMTSKELTTVDIGADINCSIKVSGNQYLFTVNSVTQSMPRTATTAKGDGYQLYPYFGGDETAPHEIRIWIKNVE